MSNISFRQCNSANYKPNRTSNIKFIVIHYTGNNGDTAEGNIKYFINNVTKTSAHYFVDENPKIWQSVKDKDTAWHCGTSGTYKHLICRNNNSLGIEMCSHKNNRGVFYFKNEVIENTVELVKELMVKYSIPIENVIRHYDVTGKICPAPFVTDIALWEAFKGLLRQKKSDLNNNQISELNLTILQSVGVINSPDYWRGVKLQYLNELLSNAAKKSVLDKRIDNGIKDIDIAFDVLIDTGIINSPAYWKKFVRTNNVQHLKDLLLNIANKSRIVLEKIVHAEAQGEGLEGQILVANVVMNRNTDRTFPTGIHNVVFQKTTMDGKTAYQFSPIADGAYAKAVPSATVKSAVDKVLDGVDNSKGATYFCTKKSAQNPNNWHEKALQFLFEYNNHRFYKEKK